ncbi:MAG: MFS transporter [Bacteroidales bacterium]|nr:MFS transporter [Bacteroidales bacterium]MCF8334430.1 MFS transporter [Bacteroidales bacterium]
MLINPAKSKIFYGWYMIGLGTLGVLMSVPGQTIGISAFTDYLLKALELTRGQLSTAYMFGTISSSFMLTFAGRMYDRHGARLVAAAAAMGMGGILIYLSFSDVISSAIITLIPAIPNWLINFIVIFLGFFLLRFFGQGALTLSSRNMIMEWFEHRRGLANALSGPFIAVGFSSAPLLFDFLINNHGWREAWQLLAIIFGFAFTVVILVFYRDKPEKFGLKPDGKQSEAARNRRIKRNKVWYEFNLKEARHKFAFWVFVISLSMFALYITGFTFHVVDVFEQVGISRQKALAIFLPASVIAFSLNATGSWLSDYIKLKHLYKTIAFGGVLSTAGLIMLEHSWAYYVIIIGNGILHGMFGILSAITWPKYFGRKHLGAISGFNQSFNVFFSAIGPWIFSQSLTFTDSYKTAGYIIMAVWAVLFIGSFFADNPQLKMRRDEEV